MNYNNKKFKVISNSVNGEVDESMIFNYLQTGNILSCEYSGVNIIKGNLLGTVDTNGTISMAYHQINNKNQLLTGVCTSYPKILDNGKIQLHEKWQWTNGNKSTGTSVLEEI